MDKRYVKSLAELVMFTYATSFLSIVTAADFDLMDISALKSAAVAAMPATLAAAYGGVSRLLGDRHSAMVVDTRQKRS